MHLDVVDLRNFYYRTPLGRVAQRAIRDQVLAVWPEAKGQTVAGFGFAVPVLRPYLAQARRVVALMPAQQGVMCWPVGMDNVSVLTTEAGWPLPTGLVDKLVVMHGLETSDDPSALLQECARVLGPGGRALFVVPNRSGLWARADGTPFGVGRPYSPSQLEGQLRKHAFMPERTYSSLFAAPSGRRFWLRTAEFWETTGRRVLPWRAGGVLIVEASKHTHAPTRPGLAAVVRRPLRALDTMHAPAPAGRFPMPGDDLC